MKKAKDRENKCQGRLCHCEVLCTRMTDMMLIFLALVLFCLTDTAVMFNVDINSSIVFKGPKNSYFGYSVAILKNSKGTWLLAGAPRANDSFLPEVHEPGVVFHCNWRSRSSCKPVFIDNVGNERQVFTKWKSVTVQNNKNNQWLGASLDVNVHGDSQVLICAPRWANHRFYVQGIQLMNGLCYESNQNLLFDKSSAWPVLGNWTKQVHSSGYFSYGMGSLGTSASYSRDGTFSVLGAPGLNDWSGGFAYIEGYTTSNPRIMELSAEMDSDSYFGMSITTAKFSIDNVSIVIGGPRAGAYGKVFAYSRNFELLLVKEGDQLGSSFGASVCAIDLNGDGLDDFAVGAPLYSEALDEGRVYVYINKDFFILELTQPLLAGSNTPGARFGTAVANVGDLNRDHFEDLAVGAPYEEDSGVVYIYNGANFGLHKEFSQRIVGKSIDNDLRAFGWSFSRPSDIDGNLYKDFAVGSFESDNVVLLRTRPVFDLYARLDVKPAVIDLNNEPMCVYNGQPWYCLEASVCLHYSGQNLPMLTEVNITLQLDTLERHQNERSRMFFTRDSDKQIELINDLVTANLNQETCYRNYTVYIRKSRDVITPLMMELAYYISFNSSNTDSISHIQNKYNPTTVSERAVFALYCGDDHVCIPLFEIQTTPVFNNINKFVLIDDTLYFDLEIVLFNNGEVSYLTVVTIDYPSSLYFATVTVSAGTTSIICVPSKDVPNTTLAILICNIMAPVKSGDKVVLMARFFTHGIPYDVHKFDMKTKVSSVGQNATRIGEKEFSLTIPVQMITEMKLSGVSIPAQLIMPQEFFSSDNETAWSHMSHLYIIRNQGPSALPHSELTLSLPTWFKLINVQIDTNAAFDTFAHIPVECSMPDSHREGHLNQTYQSERYNQLDCGSTMCSNVTCYIGLFHKYVTVYINITLAVRTKMLHMLKADKRLRLMTLGILKKPDYVSENSLTPFFNVTTTTYITYKVLSKQIITWWMLTISVSSGLFLVYILAVILWKCGFFRRKHREELHLLITSSDTEQDLFHSNSHSPNSSNIMDLPSGHSPSATNHDHNYPGLLFFPDLEQDPLLPDQSFDMDKPIHSHGQNRRVLNPNVSQFVSFHSLQPRKDHINSQRDITFHNSLYKDGRQHHSRNTQCDKLSESSQASNWVSPSPAPTSFNNDTYFEPLGYRTNH